MSIRPRQLCPVVVTDRIYHQSVALPMPDGIAHPGGIGVRRMRAVDGDYAEHVQVFVENDDLIKPLYDLPLIRNKVGERDTGGHAVGINASVGWTAHHLILF